MFHAGFLLRLVFVLIATLTLAEPLLAASDLPRSLTFKDRVEAQRAIERVYHSHKVGSPPPFHEAVPRAVLEARVRRYLAQSAALEEWGRPVTAEALRRELERIAGNTHSPDRLQEIYAALGRDPILIQECFARPALVERLTRNALLAGRPGELRQEEGDRATDRATRPRTWNEWWGARSHGLSFDSVPTVAEAGVPLPLPVSEGTAASPPCLPDDTWNNGSLGAIPIPRVGETVVWTGSEMLVWGGYPGKSSEGFLRSGGRYDPLTDTWATLSEIGAPEARSNHAAVWTGSELLVWGGCSGGIGWCTVLDTGGRYDPVTDSWTPMSTSGAPPPSVRASAVWTGSEMLVWGGNDGYWEHAPLGTGGRYDPSTDTWSAISSVGAPSSRFRHTAVWAGDRMIVWGGFDDVAEMATGGLYDPATDTWTATSSVGAPSPRQNHSAVWTGAEMIVWGGDTGPYGILDTGGRYDPATGTWIATAQTAVPVARTRHGAVWTGTEMILWGGQGAPGGAPAPDAGARYDPTTDGWSAISTAGAPPRREHPAMLWIGDAVIAWGGSFDPRGGIYDLATDSWVPTAESDLPWGPWDRSTVWSGNRMLIWGSGCFYDLPGIRFDPLVDDWSFMSTLGEPSARCYSEAVWTGTEMIVWGGTFDDYDPNQYTDTGGRYDPVADSWRPTSTMNAPSPRAFGSAVWTGTEMIVWGGLLDYFWTSPAFNDGGRYDPVTDGWTPTSIPAALEDRTEHTAVWTGTEMIIWGGLQPEGDGWASGLPHGWRYDPSADSWLEIPHLPFEPFPATGHTAVWSGAEMIIWGGNSSAVVGEGAKYDPVRNRWRSTTESGAPSGRAYHFAAWTGSEMIVWGGSHNIEVKPNSWTGHYPNSGGRYDPASNQWTPTTVDHAPLGRYAPQAVWTGSEMIVWAEADSGGGRYALDHSTDDDGDGFSECAGDCNDAASTAWPGAPELCDTIDNDCDGDVDEDFDLDGDGHRTCTGDCDDLDPGAYAPPGAVKLLEVTTIPGGMRLTWESQAVPAGAGTAYDLFTGLVLGVATSGGDISGGSCLMENLADPVFDVLGPDPPLGDGMYFMLRAQNGCGTGTWGSPGRDSTAASSPVPCG